MNVIVAQKLKVFVTILLVVVCVVGCDRNKNNVSSRVKNYTSSEAVSEEVFDENEKTKTLTHDFGVIIQPIQNEVTCEFEIKNETENTWNLKRIVNTCSCTIADMTSPKIEAGKIEKILVVYKPVGNGVFDDTRKSLVTFKEEEAPQFVLYIKSRVRELMTIRPKSLSWTRVGENQTRKDNFEIQNFTKNYWDGLEIVAKPDWMKIDINSASPPQSEPSMKQLWLADVSVETAGLSSGEHRGEIILKSTGGSDNQTKTMPVVLQITSAVSAIPAQFFFGEIKPNETVTKSIKVVFSPDSIPADKNEIHFEHEFGDLLQLDWLSTEGDSWELQASMKLGDKKIPDEPIVTMTFSKPKLPKITIPVYVMTGGER